MTLLAARLLGVALLIAAPLFARADVWGYIDDKGVAHFAAERVDERYELFSRGASFDSERALAPGGTAGGRSPIPPDPSAAEVSPRAPRLVAYVENSPTYRQVQPHLREASQANNLDYELVKAVIAAESGFDAQAVSPKGAIGLMQVIPATAERFGVSGDARTPVEKKLTDPRTNIRAGTRYLRHLLNLFEGKLDLALAAYNAGEGAVQRAGNRIPDFRETQNYVKTVLQIYAVLKPVPVSVPVSTPAAAAGAASPPRRVRMEIPASIPGLVPGRANMPPSLR